MKNKRNDIDRLDSATNAALGAGSAEVVGRFGSAMKEHIVAYSGVDNEFGTTLKRGLKDIANSKVNLDYEYANLKQQAGFAAEVKHTARQNAENIINKTGKKVARTDDVGEVNNQLHDHYTYDKNGNIIDKSQMKFVGKNADEALNKLASKKFEKYLDDPIDVPKEMADEIKAKAAQKAQECRANTEKLEQMGKNDEANKQLAQAEKYDKLNKNVRKSTLTSDEAMEARTNPLLSTAKDMGKLAHRAGVEQAKIGAMIGGGISGIKNIVAICKDEKNVKEAMIDVGIDTAKAGAVSYATAATGSLIKSGMQNSASVYTRTLSKTNLPVMIVTTSIEVSKTFTRYFKGEIDGVECFEELGEKGVGMLSSSMFAVAFQMAVPIPVLGAMIGGMVGYAFSSAYYNAVLEVFKSAKLAKEERIRIEAECEEAIRMIREYREQMNKLIESYFVDYLSTFNNAFTQMHDALKIGDIESFIGGGNEIINKLGKDTQFKSFSDIDDFMNDKNTILKI